MKALPFPPSFSPMPLTSPLVLGHGQSQASSHDHQEMVALVVGRVKLFQTTT